MNFLDSTGKMVAILENHLVSGSTLNTGYLKPIDSEFGGDILRLDIQDSLFKLLYFSCNSVSVLHHYDVMAFRFCGKTRQNQQKEKWEKSSRARRNASQHSSTPTYTK